MRFCVLGSGSKGNAVLVDAGGTLVLVDCGYSTKEIRRRMSDVGCELTQLRGLLITHGHGDHVKGARKLASGMNLLTYCTDDTITFCARRSGLVNHARVVPGEPFVISKTLTVTAFSTPHDAKGSVGFVLDDGHSKLGFCTDLGAPDVGVIEALRGVDALYLEFNHDLQMLNHGPYPARLKRRVASRFGHLCNEDAARILRASKTKRLKRVVMAHLSEVNNTPRLALAAAAAAVGDDDIAMIVAPQHAPSAWFPVGDDRTTNTSTTPTRDVLVDKLSRKTSEEGPAYGMHPAAVAAADERAEVVGGAPGRTTHARAAARARAARLFGEQSTAPTPKVETVKAYSVRVQSSADVVSARSAAAMAAGATTATETRTADTTTTAVATGASSRAKRTERKSAALALKLAQKAEAEKLATAREAAAAEASAANEKVAAPDQPPSTGRSPSSKRKRHPMIAVHRQLSLFGGAGDDA